MMTRLICLYTSAQASVWRWLPMSILMLLGFYSLQLAALVLRFGDLPNYANVYDWPTNLRVIIESTPSFKDTLSIIKDEWIVEVGYMNYDFGIGISEWSLFVAPAKVVVVYLMCLLLAINLCLLSRPIASCRRARALKAANGMAGLMAATASLTLSWVVCCSTPTWVVGLSMLGLGVSTALALEPLGLWLQLAGVATMVVVALVLAPRSRPADTAAHSLNSDSRRTDDYDLCRTPG